LFFINIIKYLIIVFYLLKANSEKKWQRKQRKKLLQEKRGNGIGIWDGCYRPFLRFITSS